MKKDELIIPETLKANLMISKKNATLIGLLAVLLWASTVGFIRSVTEHFGAVGGAALIYSVASFILIFTVGLRSLSGVSRKYLIWGSFLFVTYELCFSLSIGFAHNGRQAIEVGMVNYLWPTFTMIAAIIFNKQKFNLLIIPGFFLAILGICWILGGEQGLDWIEMKNNIRVNPLSYGLAFLGALLWATYCILTARMAGGKNGVTLFFIMVAIALWGKYFISDGGRLTFSVEAMIYLILCSASMGFGYAAWNVGIMHGNVTLLACASYFIPVISAALAAILLHTALPLAFWKGVSMVCMGSILCWWATHTQNRTS